MRRLSTLAAVSLLVAGCVGASTPPGSPGPLTAQPPPSDAPRSLRYVAMGDTYPIGFGLPRQVDRWPNQLVRALKPAVPLDLVENLAGQSATTYDVIDEQLPVLETLDPDLVSLQVGVNDIVISRLSDTEYRDNLATILDGRDGPPASFARAGILDLVDADHVLLVTTPDYTLVPDQPFVRPGDAETVDRFNAILREVAAERGIAVVDIAPISDLVARDPTLLTDDEQHPSAKQYAGWVEFIAPIVRRLAQGTPSPSPSDGPSGTGVG
jgi:lysophospholipase L1-like esterase